MLVSQIVACSKNGVIGVNNDLPWDIPEDMQFFRDKTKGHILIMGRKTYESIGKPLPKRLNIVITRQEGFDAGGAIVVKTIDEALKVAKENIGEWPEEVFISGGGEIYKQSLPQTERVYLTLIDKEFEGEAFYPYPLPAEFVEIADRPRTEPVRFSFKIFEKTRN